MLERVRDFLLYWDYSIWYYINSEWHTPFLDLVVPFLRNQWTWVPIYVFLAVFMPKNFGKRGWIWCAGFILAFALSDQVSAHLIKPLFHRTRPCNNPNLVDFVHTLVPCGGGYSFPSSHASNHFSISVFMASTLHKYVKWIWPVAILWAMVVCYAQIYVGVHFPLDICAGAVVGITTGALTAYLFKRRYELQLIH